MSIEATLIKYLNTVGKNQINSANSRVTVLVVTKISYT